MVSFPLEANGFAFGSAEAGLARIQAERGQAINSPTEIQELFVKLETQYLVVQASDAGRRNLSRSDPVKGPYTNKHRTKEDKLQSIYVLEVQLAIRQEKAIVQAEKDGVDVQLASVLAEVRRASFHNRIGDYLAVLKQELKEDQRMHEFEFKDYKFVTNLMDQLQKEDSGAQTVQGTSIKPSTPIRDSLVSAYSFLTSVYTSADQLIDMLQIYADRNTQAHNGAKKYYDDRNFHGLHSLLVRDKNEVDSLGFSQEDREKFLECLEAVRKTFYKHFTWKMDGDHRLTARGKILEGEAKFDKEGNLIPSDTKPVFAPLTKEEERKQRAERRAREKAIREATKAELVHNTKSDFEEAIHLADKVHQSLANSGIASELKASQCADLEKLSALVKSLQQQNEDLQFKLDQEEKVKREWEDRYEKQSMTLKKVQADHTWEKRRREKTEEELFEMHGVSGLGIDQEE